MIRKLDISEKLKLDLNYEDKGLKKLDFSKQRKTLMNINDKQIYICETSPKRQNRLIDFHGKKPKDLNNNINAMNGLGYINNE